MPLWFRILAAADFDPLRAQELEEQLSQDWWERYWIATGERAKVERAQAKRKR